MEWWSKIEVKLQGIMIIFQYQTDIMLRKKLSEIYVQRPVGAHSPLTRFNQVSNLSRTPQRTNLSPIRHHQIQMASGNRTPRKQFIVDSQLVYKSPRKREDNFESQLQSLANNYSHNYKSNPRFQNNQTCLRLGNALEGTSYVNVSNISNNPPERMKESKKLFTQYISQMKSEKKRDYQLSNKSSVLEDSRQPSQHYSVNQHEGSHSFKNFSKIQMIESVRPSIQGDRSPERKPLLPSKKSDKQPSKATNNALQQNISPFQVIEQQMQKKQKLIQLVNQSFSNPNSTVVANPKLKNDALQTKVKEQVDQIYVQQSSELADFNLLLKLADITNAKKVHVTEQQMVKMSLESAKDGLSMDPFL